MGDELGINASESITLTIKKRIGLVKKSIFEIKRVVDDVRSKVVGGITTGLVLWESCIIPFLLHNSSTWMEIKQSDMETLSKLQNLFFSTLLAVKNSPALAMVWDLGALCMPMRILKEKLILYYHISSLSEDSLAHKILKTQEQFHYTSLRNEIKHFLSRFNVYDVTCYNKLEWKMFVREKIKDLNKEFLLQEMRKYKKIDVNSMARKDFGLKDYFKDLTLECHA